MKNLKIKAARALKDMSQGELADKVDVSRQTIVAIEKGDYNHTINLRFYQHILLAFYNHLHLKSFLT